jgi:hypothetical protein
VAERAAKLTLYHKLEPLLLDFETVLKIHTVIAFPEKIDHHEKSMLCKLCLYNMSVALQVDYFTPIQSVKMPFLTEYMLADSIENNTIHIRQESSLPHEPSNWKGKKQNLK